MQNAKESSPLDLFLASAAGFGAAAAFAFTFALPIMQKQDNNKIFELDSKIKNINSLHDKEITKLKNDNVLQLKEINSLKSKNEMLTSKNDVYRSRLLELSTLSTFQHGQPLPIGYSSILPGMDLSDVIDKYQKEILDIDPKGEFITANVEAGGINRIVYSAGVEEVPGVIASITVHKYDLETSVNGKKTDNKINSLSLLGFLQENLGHKEQCASGQYVWRIDEHRYVYYDEDTPYYYHVFFNGIYAPGTSLKCRSLIHTPVKRRTL